ncbi:ATP-dependent nuclease [[Mycoplasma] testudinis]|uniref:ATP-dependent nuclease n=1 Tax=[Mycoplasma] testudinis TaxID=33924 RepID=UPI00047F0ED0|nr:TOPRIM nucleotidyl transferase/hydrolase domain-containing protein [[Mycoplasma] testudinis]
MIEIYIGENKTGKSLHLSERRDASKLAFYVESDMREAEFLNYFKKVLKSEEDFYVPFLCELVNFIEDFFKLIKNNLQNQQPLSLRWKEFVHDLKIKYENETSFEKCIINSMDCDDNGIVTFNNMKDVFGETSTGTRSFTILAILSHLLEVFLKNEKRTEMAVILDIPEHILHPELMYKVSKLICKIGERINVYMATFSPLVLKSIYAENERYHYTKIHYYYCFKRGDDGYFEMNLHEVLKRNNTRRVNLITQILFSKKAILVEGINDTTFFLDIIDRYFPEQYISIIDCGGKGEVHSVFSELECLQVDKYIKIVKVFDDDKAGENENQEENSIIFYPNIESSFFLTYGHGNKTWVKTKKGRIGKSEIDFRVDFVLSNATIPNAQEKFQHIINRLHKFLGM